MAIDCRTAVAAAPRSDRRIRCVSVGYPGEIAFDIDPDLRPAPDWANHIRGVVACLERGSPQLAGADLWIHSDVPPGAGLSSSAALEVAVGYALLSVGGRRVELLELALAAQRAEHEFAGTRCGIMDQYTACLGQEGQALFIDCRSLSSDTVPLDIAGCQIVVCNTRVKHDLATGEYNTRRWQCQEGVRLLSTRLHGLRSLRDVTPDDLDRHGDLLPELILRRCRHVVTENRRTQAAVSALRQRDLPHLGRLMYDSHASLRDDYSVSCRELDTLVDLARRSPEVLGGRMTGGGFGGCTIHLVTHEGLEDFLREVPQAYEASIGIRPDLYVPRPSAGVREEG